MVDQSARTYSDSAPSRYTRLIAKVSALVPHCASSRYSSYVTSRLSLSLRYTSTVSQGVKMTVLVSPVELGVDTSKSLKQQTVRFHAYSPRRAVVSDINREKSTHSGLKDGSSVPATEQPSPSTSAHISTISTENAEARRMKIRVDS